MAYQENQVKESVDHPPHYTLSGPQHEHVKCAEAWGLVKNAFLYNCSKYICRAGKKDPSKTLEDLLKAQWYLNREIKRLQKESK